MGGMTKGHKTNWNLGNKINNVTSEYNLKYKINTHESILTQINDLMNEWMGKKERKKERKRKKGRRQLCAENVQITYMDILAPELDCTWFPAKECNTEGTKRSTFAVEKCGQDYFSEINKVNMNGGKLCYQYVVLTWCGEKGTYPLWPSSQTP